MALLRRRIMKFQISSIKGDMPSHAKVKKAATIAIVFNVMEIIAGLVMIVLVNRMLSGGVEASIARMTTVLCVTIVGWGAITDINAALTSLQLVHRTRELEEAYGQLEDLNREMRAQRHDFMNHLQVVYSLIEMNEPGEAVAYMDKVYGDMQRVSRMLRTACPAVNALIQAKVAEAAERGAELKLSIAAKWDDELMPAWEICRVLANLIDNALDAALAAEHPQGENWCWARTCAAGSSPCATTVRRLTSSSGNGFLSPASPPSARGRAWDCISSARRLLAWVAGLRWNLRTEIRIFPVLCP